MDRTSALMVGVGGVLGASVRWALVEYLDQGAPWPTAAFVANVAGCLLLGLLMGRYRPILHTSTLIGATTGFCGAMTTFSGFAVDVGLFARDQRWGLLAVYLTASLGVGLVAFVTGAAGGRRLLATSERP